MSSFPAVARRLCVGVFVLFTPLHAATWLKLQTEDVVVYSDASTKDVVEFAVGYSAFRHVFREMFAPPRPPPATVVVLYRRLSTLRENVPEGSGLTKTVSFSADIDGTMLLACAVEGDRAETLRQTIEFDTVWGLGRCGYRMPLWAAQGAGMVLASLKVGDASCVVGGDPTGFATRWHDNQGFPWPQFFAAVTSSPEYQFPRGQFHAQAWALMHLVLLPREGANHFADLVSRLQAQDSSEAVQAALGVPISGLTSRVTDHVRGSLTHVEYPFDAAGLRSRLSVTPAPDFEVHVTQANILIASDKAGKAGTEIAAAEKISPLAPQLLEAKARRDLRAKQPAGAVRYYREAIAAGSVNPYAFLRSAEERMNEISSGQVDEPGSGGKGAEEAYTEIRKALQLDPTSSEAYRLFGRALVLRPTINSEDVAQLTVGISRGPMGQRIRLYRAMAYERLGRTDEYIADLRAVWSDPLVEAPIKQAVRTRLLDAELKPFIASVEAFIHRGDFAGARAIVTRAKTDLSPELGDRVTAMASWVKEQEAISALAGLEKEKRWPEVQVAGEAFLSEFPNSETAPIVRKLVDRAKKRQAAAPTAN